jgi:CheY-like chemotaxis protein
MSLEPLSSQPQAALPSILLVEDHDSRQEYALELREAGFSVQQAGSGEEALESVLERVPDVLVTDISLPGMSGTALCRHVRRLSIAKQIKMIAVAPSPGGMPQALDGTTDAGFDAVLVKPFLPEELVGTVRRLFERGRELRHRSLAVRAKAVQTTQRSNRLHLQSRVFLAAAGIMGIAVSCPGCHQPIAWRETNRINQIRFDYFQPCVNGCGEYLFDHLRRRFVKLRS